MKLTKKQLNNFSRHLILEGFGEKKQNIIFNSHITFIGVGGINCPAIIYLLSMGIKNITIIDYDKVQLSNLNRQIIFSKNDIGKYKVHCAKKYLKNNFNDANIKYHNIKINKKNCSKIISKTNIVIDGTDNWQTMIIINDYCVKNNIPLLSASVAGYDGNFILLKNYPNKHLCLRCIFPLKRDLNLPRCETVGILGTSAGIIGILSAHKVINFLTLDDKYSNIIYFDGKKLDFKEIKVSANHVCKLLK